MSRTIAIGDIHGHAQALVAVLDAAAPAADDLIISIGDVIDRGPDSKQTIQVLLELSQRCKLVVVKGNHEEMFLAVRHGELDASFWLACGGQETADSYGGIDQIPENHLGFIESCVDFYETDKHIFSHASYSPELPMKEQPGYVLRWQPLFQSCPPHCSGKTAIVGHTRQLSGEVLDLGHIKCIDTNCYGGGWLTALDVTSGKIWQADSKGNRRERKS